MIISNMEPLDLTPEEECSLRRNRGMRTSGILPRIKLLTLRT